MLRLTCCLLLFTLLLVPITSQEIEPPVIPELVAITPENIDLLAVVGIIYGTANVYGDYMLTDSDLWNLKTGALETILRDTENCITLSLTVREQTILTRPGNHSSLCSFDLQTGELFPHSETLLPRLGSVLFISQMMAAVYSLDKTTALRI